ncbi:MAG: sigma 54-interacting transcriptional regulator [Candidatus Aureabacteria bacterium]|nr:sigma 54-interacting transcriptional regulator [Candidatus Auribacterota bacterium]
MKATPNATHAVERLLFNIFLEFLGAQRGLLLMRPPDEGNSRWELTAAEGLGNDVPGSHAFEPYMRVISSVQNGGKELFISDRAWQEMGLSTGPKGSEYLPNFLICLPLKARGKIVAIIYADGQGEPPPRLAMALRVLFPSEQSAEGPQDLGVPDPKSERQDMNLKGRWRPVREHIQKIIGGTEVMHEVRGLVEKAAVTSITVLLEGETGTGKEIIARAIHYSGPRRKNIFLAQNCAALPVELLESELFGYVRGAFTGANTDKRGLLIVADGGTMFLDEITECSLPIQAKLLRVIESGIIRPVGSTREVAVDIRIIAATNRSLENETQRGTFRKDLFYRLNVFPIRVPPLRERRDDIPLLAQHFLDLYAKSAGKSIEGFTSDAMRALMAYDFMGNVRELENEIERIIVMHEEAPFIGADALSLKIRKVADRKSRGSVIYGRNALKSAVKDAERDIIAEALASSGGNVTRTAKRLGVSRYGLYKKLADHNMRPPKE